MKGIYRISNTTNNKSYIGSSVNIKARWGTHKRELRGNYHDNQHLQNAWSKQGEGSFVFEVVLLCEEFELFRYEQWFLDNIVKWGFDYNIAECVAAPMRGRKHTKETKRKMSSSMEGNTGRLGTHLTEEHKQKISKAVSGLSNGMFGKSHTKERKDMVSLQFRGSGNTHAKLNEGKVKLIRRMWGIKKYNQTELGKLFNIHGSSISDVVTYKTWKFVEET